MAAPLTGEIQFNLHLEELQAQLNPELIGKAEYRLRVWLNGLERWETEKPIKVAEGGATAIGAVIPMHLNEATDVLSIRVLAAELDLLLSLIHISEPTRPY